MKAPPFPWRTVLDCGNKVETLDFIVIANLVYALRTTAVLDGAFLIQIVQSFWKCFDYFTDIFFLVYSKETLDHECQWHPLQTLLAVVLPSVEDIWTSRRFSWAGHNFEGYNAPIGQSAIYHSPWWLCKLIIWCWCWYSCPPAHTRETDNRFFLHVAKVLYASTKWERKQRSGIDTINYHTWPRIPMWK